MPDKCTWNQLIYIKSKLILTKLAVPIGQVSTWIWLHLIGSCWADPFVMDCTDGLGRAIFIFCNNNTYHKKRMFIAQLMCPVGHARLNGKELRVRLSIISYSKISFFEFHLWINLFPLTLRYYTSLYGKPTKALQLVSFIQKRFRLR